MKILVDSAFPRSVDGVPNVDGIALERVTIAVSDRDLIERAADQGCPAIVLLGSEIVSQESVRAFAQQRSVTLICSTTDDPFEAETNLRQALATIAVKVQRHRGEVVWLRKDGLREEDRQ